MSEMTIKAWDGRVAWTGEATSIADAVQQARASDAVLRAAILRGAGAVLRGADLTILRDADLTGAILAILRGAVLRGADLRAWRMSPLLMLLDQPGAIRAYKLVTADYQSPLHHTRITYAVGQRYEVTDANTDPMEPCGAGLHVASMDWILREWRDGMRVLLVEFMAADIACIPVATDGKFRLHRMTVVGEVDLVARGLVDAPKTSEAAS